jgi:hypothetical protein
MFSPGQLQGGHKGHMIHLGAVREDFNMPKPNMLRPAAAFVLLAAMFLAGCKSSAPKAQSFVGQGTDSTAFVGIVNDNGALTAYVCDGTDTTVSLAEWFNGSASNGTFDLTSVNGAHLAGAITDQEVTGTMTRADGRSFAFALGLGTGNAGVYRAEQTTGNGTYAGGWIVLPNGDQRGAVTFQGTKGDSYLPVGGLVPVARLAMPVQAIVLQNQITLIASRLGG